MTAPSAHRTPPRRTPRRRALARRQPVAACGALVALAVLAAGCGTARGAAVAGHTGTVSVLYAGSLVNLMEHDAGPAFAAATGYTYQGYGAGSSSVAHQIQGRVRRGDVFISASPKVDTTLLGRAGGGWLSWYATFAQAPLVLAYDPHSRFAAALRSAPWYDVLSRPGIRVGRTDPTLDPKGQLTVQALAEIGRATGRPGLAGTITARTQVFPEEELLGRLEAGQLDAGFFYTNEAADHHLPTVPLSPVRLHATFTVTVLNRAPDAAGGVAFVHWLLGRQGRALLAAHGLTAVPPTVSGDRAAVPPGLRGDLPSR